LFHGGIISSAVCLADFDFDLATDKDITAARKALEVARAEHRPFDVAFDFILAGISRRRAASHPQRVQRHTFGTRMAAAGVPMRSLQEMMGHRDFKTTLIYADYAPGAHEAELVAAAFARAGNGRVNGTPVTLSAADDENDV
jgi:integrase